MVRLLSLLLLASAIARTQTLPTDSATGKISYHAVLAVPGASADELYSRARAWFAQTYRSANNVLELEDAASGELLGKGWSYVQSAKSTFGQRTYYTVRIACREGRFRYQITDLYLKTSPPVQDITLEYYVDKAHNKKGELKPNFADWLRGLDQAMQSLATSIRTGLSTDGATKKGTDW